MPTLNDVIGQFLLVDRHPQTKRNYQVMLRHLAEALDGQRSIDTVTHGELLAYIGRRKAELKPRTAQNYLTAVKALFAFAVRAKALPDSPAEGLKLRLPPAAAEEGDRAMPPDELQRVVAYAQRRSARDYALVLFLADTGARVGGVAGATIRKLHLEARWADIPRKGGGDYRVYFSQTTATALRAWLAVRPPAQHDFIFSGRGGRPYASNALSGHIRYLSKLACGRAYGPHSIRHAVGHAYAESGVVPSVTAGKLGHRSVLTTLNFYYPRHQEAVREASEQLALIVLRSGAAPKEQKAHKDKVIRVDFRKG